jgi:DDE superfamily endonuclease
MLTPSTEIIQLVATFAVAMSPPTFAKAQTLLYGAILAPGRRTIAAILRVMGLHHQQGHECYHRVFSRDVWSPMVMSRLLLLLLVKLFVCEGECIELIIDESLVRRWGKKIHYKGLYRDGVRSTVRRVVLSTGIRWCVVCLLVRTPWCRRPWALPFLVMPVLSKKVSLRLHKPFRGTVECTREAIRRVRHWLPDQEIIVTADGDYAAVELLQECQGLEQPVTLVCRSRLDMRLFAPPSEEGQREDGSKRRGRKPKKGARQPSLAERLKDDHLEWQTITVNWYGGQQRAVELLTGVSLWHRQGVDPVVVRWVLVRSVRETKTGEVPEGFKPSAYLCTKVDATVEQILRWVVDRWNIEVTFEEMREHMGLETQRNWSLRSIGRTTPCLFGVFSLVVAMAKVLHPESLPVEQTAWYKKEEPTFSDALAAVRSHLWACLWKARQAPLRNWSDSPADPDQCLIPSSILQHMQDLLCYA